MESDQPAPVPARILIVDDEEAVERRSAALRGALNDVAEARRQIHGAHLDTIRRLVLVAEYKDEDTAAHVERIGLFSQLLAKEAGKSPREAEIIQVENASGQPHGGGFPDGKDDPGVL